MRNWSHSRRTKSPTAVRVPDDDRARFIGNRLEWNRAIEPKPRQHIGDVVVKCLAVLELEASAVVPHQSLDVEKPVEHRPVAEGPVPLLVHDGFDHCRAKLQLVADGRTTPAFPEVHAFRIHGGCAPSKPADLAAGVVCHQDDLFAKLLGRVLHPLPVEAGQQPEELVRIPVVRHIGADPDGNAFETEVTRGGMPAVPGQDLAVRAHNNRFENPVLADALDEREEGRLRFIDRIVELVVEPCGVDGRSTHILPVNNHFRKLARDISLRKERRGLALRRSATRTGS